MNEKKSLIIICITLISLSLVSAQEDDVTVVSPPSQAVDSKMLQNYQASILKNIETMKDEIKKDLTQYNDENYRLLDTRINNFLDSARKKVIVGMLGLNFFVAAGMAYVFNMLNKKHSLLSYERKLQQFRMQEAQKAQQQQPQAEQQPQQPQMQPQPQYQELPPEQYPQEQYPQQPYQEPYPDQGYYQEYPQYPQEGYGGGTG
jgi:hypothetical protein